MKRSTRKSHIVTALLPLAALVTLFSTSRAEAGKVPWPWESTDTVRLMHAPHDMFVPERTVAKITIDTKQSTNPAAGFARCELPLARREDGTC